MIPIEKTLVSDQLIEEKFVCDLQRCKGACCVQGVSGAPLEADELELLEESYPFVKPYLTPEGIRAIERKGFYVKDADDDWVTPLIGRQGACAYTVYENGIAACGIEKAFREGKTVFKKPLSCHLYPVRITRLKNYDAVNYHEWEICSPACELGKQLKVPVFEFVRDALIRKYGEAWFAQLKKHAAQKGKSRKPTVNKF